ncbi:MAG: GtrA family protein [Clostridia bacterium]|nr:GtrA family protein [Clostridia bacterium]
MKKKIIELIKKYEEILKYLIIGLLTTIVNYIVFIILVNNAKIEMHTSNIIAWIVSVIFAYFTNKLFVFESKSFKLKVLIKEISTFGIARILSLLLEELILYIFVNLLNMNKLIIKLIANIVVIILNYILSKFIIFRKTKNK